MICEKVGLLSKIKFNNRPVKKHKEKLNDGLLENYNLFYVRFKIKFHYLTILKPNWFSDIDASAFANAEASFNIKI